MLLFCRERLTAQELVVITWNGEWNGISGMTGMKSGMKSGMESGMEINDEMPVLSVTKSGY